MGNVTASVEARSTSQQDAEAALIAQLRAGPSTWRELWALLKIAGHPRTTIDRAVARGVIVAEENGWTRGQAKRFRLSLNNHPGTASGHFAAETVPTVPLSSCHESGTSGPILLEQVKLSRLLSPLSRVPGGDGLSSPIQEDLPQQLDLNSHHGTAQRDASVGTAQRDASVGTEHRDAASRAPNEEHQAAVRDGQCCGRAPGSQLRCKLCRWSPTYSGALRMLRGAGREAFAAQDRLALVALQGSAVQASVSVPLEPVRRLTDGDVEAACAELRAIPREAFIPRDPYRPIEADATPVDFCEPRYVQGRRS
jgi:hypothetical protein